MTISLIIQHYIQVLNTKEGGDMNGLNCSTGNVGVGIKRVSIQNIVLFFNLKWYLPV